MHQRRFSTKRENDPEPIQADDLVYVDTETFPAAF
jgi:hypothetical protein